MYSIFVQLKRVGSPPTLFSLCTVSQLLKNSRMNKQKFSLIVILVLFSFLYSVGQEISGEHFSSIGDKKSYKLALKEGTIEAYSTFLEAFPKSKYYKKVTILYEEVFYIHAYDFATKKFELDSLNLYLEAFPEGKYAAKANEAIDIISWQKAKSKNTPEAIEAYILQFPEGRATALAKQILAKMNTDR